MAIKILEKIIEPSIIRVGDTFKLKIKIENIYMYKEMKQIYEECTHTYKDFEEG